VAPYGPVYSLAMYINIPLPPCIFASRWGGIKETVAMYKLSPEPGNGPNLHLRLSQDKK